MRTVFLLGVLVAVPMWGCSCFPGSTPPCQAAWAGYTAAVFTGTVLEITEPAPPAPLAPSVGNATGRRLAGDFVPAPVPRQRVIRFQVGEALIGEAPKAIDIATGIGGGDCGYAFQRGVEYIVYASKNQSGQLTTGICSRTRPIEEAAEDMDYFHSLAGASPGAALRIFTSDPSSRFSSLPGVRVSVDGAGGRSTSTTDDAGHATFTGLPPGEYTVSESLDGYVGWTGKVQLHSKGCAEISARLILDRRVTGRLLTKEGLPAAGVPVQVLPIRPGQLRASDSITTDAEGHFELWRFDTGDYYLGINLDHTPTSQNPYTRWFYPGTEDPAGAVPIHIGSVPGTQQVDLVLPDRQRDRTIGGTLLWPDGRPAMRAQVSLADPRWPAAFPELRATTDAEGHFLVHGFDGTRYRLHATAPARVPSEATSAEPAAIQPGKDALNLRLLLTRKGDSLREEREKAIEQWRNAGKP